MSDLKKAWKQTAKSFILAFNDLGASLLDSVNAGRDIAVEWARKDNPHVENDQHVEAEGVEVTEDTAPTEEAASTENTAE